MLTAIKKLCLLGVEPFQEPEIARRILLTNGLAWLACLLSLPQIVYYVEFGSTPVVVSALLAIPFFLAIPVLNWLHFHLTSRVTLLVVAMLTLVVYSRLLAADVGFSLFYFPLAVIPFYLFIPRERIALPMALIAVGMFLLVKQLEPAWAQNLGVFSEPFKAWLRYAIWLECFLVLCLPALIQFVLSARSPGPSEEEQLRRIQSSRVLALVEVSRGLGHEINNPLAIIAGNAEQIRSASHQKTIDLAKIEMAVDSILENSARITKTLKALKLIAREGDEHRCELVSAAQLIQGVLAVCEQRIQQLRIKLIVDCPPEMQLEVSPSQFSHVLFHLVGNAVYAVSQLPERWIKIACFETADGIEISVTDSGLGVPQTIQDKIMEAFFTTKSTGEGMGVGLSIARSLVEAHGGRLTYDAKSLNTRFVIRLPRRRVARLRAAA